MLRREILWQFPMAMVCLAVTTAFGEATASKPTGRAVLAPPELSAEDQTFLIGLVRRTLQEQVAGRQPSEATQPPATLGFLRCPAVVTLRRGGLALTVGQSAGGEDVVEGCRIATREAVAHLPEGRKLTEDLLSQIAVQIELLGPLEELSVNLKSRSNLAWEYVAGLDGVAIRIDDRSSLMTAGQSLAYGLSPGETIDLVVGRLALTEAQVKERASRSVCMRFRTLHFWQANPQAPVVELHRGCRVIRKEEVTARKVDEAIRQIAGYLRQRCRSDDRCAYAYYPWSDQFEEDGPTIAQAGAAWSLACHGAWAGDEASLTTSRRIIKGLCRNLSDVGPSRSEGARSAAESAATRPAYLRCPDQVDRLGASAMLLLAACEMPPSREYRPLRDRLSAGILTRQMPTGLIEANFATTQRGAPQDTDPGQALWAMARTYRVDRSPAILTFVRNAYDHYQKQFSVKPTFAVIPWQACAFAEIALAAPERRYIDYVFGMVDRLEPYQLTDRNCAEPLMRGGIDTLGQGVAGVSTGIYLAAVADALGLARRVGDKTRVDRYERMLRSGTRFMLQLEFRQEECYYVRSRADTVGGVRTTPWDHTLSIDNCQHALFALIKARRMIM